VTVTEWSNTLQHVALWGPGILILAAIYLLIKRPPGWVQEFIKSQVDHAAATHDQAMAMARMAEAVDMAIHRVSKIDELLVGQQLILSRLETLERRLK